MNGKVLHEGENELLKTRSIFVAIGRDEGATLLAGGHRLDQGSYARGWYHEATLFGDWPKVVGPDGMCSLRSFFAASAALPRSSPA